MSRLEPCAYCKSGYDHSSLGNCPQCGAPTEQKTPMYMLMVKGVTLEEWHRSLIENHLATPSEVRLMMGIGESPIETTRSPFTTWR